MIYFSLVISHRLAFRIPEVFIENMVLSLERSINAWKRRYELERMKQGLFHSKDEALSRGWHELKITVLASKIVPTRAYITDNRFVFAFNIFFLFFYDLLLIAGSNCSF